MHLFSEPKLLSECIEILRRKNNLLCHQMIGSGLIMIAKILMSAETIFYKMH